MPSQDMENENIGKTVWCKVEDTDLWAICTVEKFFKGEYHLRRARIPKGELDPTGAILTTKIVVDEKKFATLKPGVPHDIEHPHDTEDLVSLMEPTEETMLHNLRERYEKDTIFTNIGPVLVAINPYQPVQCCKSATLAELSRMDPEQLPSHAYTIAHAAYSGLVDAIPGEPQSVLVSGESGAGKTETTKILVACLALCSSSSGAVVEAALESGLLLEAFGNAKTVYNNNSSRFGKWCAVHFDDRGRMAACKLQAFLLEQSRIVMVSEGERNYHIFYHLLFGASNMEKAMWGIKESNDAYTYTKGQPTSPGIDDAAEWAETQRRMYGLGFNNDAVRTALFQLVAAVLALGNLSFVAGSKKIDGMDAMEVKDKAQLALVGRLLQVDASQLENKLVTKPMMVNGEKMNMLLNEAQCVDNRDALAKAIYSAIFEHIVERVNSALGHDHTERSLVSQQGSANDPRAATGTGDWDPDRYIGLLDIFGFENFRLNLFEQLCINFTNERLQQFFMNALIQREQTEYDREGIKCDHIEYPNNAAQVDLLDNKKAGIFAMLDEQCRTPNASDEKFIAAMHNAFAEKKKGLYSKPKFGANAVGADLSSQIKDVDKLQFIITHYAEDVQYTALGWLEKNRGKLQPDLASLIQKSESILLQTIAPPVEETTSKGPTVSGRFRASLNKLSATMMATHQHFIRCMKPNQAKLPGKLEGLNVCRQMRYLGVHAVIEINRVGYPVKMLFEDFVRKYRCIAFDTPKYIADTLPRGEVCTNLLKRAGLEQDGEKGWGTLRTVQMGKTKIFMKPEIVPLLDVPRRAARVKAAISVQAFARRRICRRIRMFVRVHAMGVKAVRNVLDRPDPDQKAETIENRVADSGMVLDELIAVCEQSTLPISLAPILERCEARKDALENELRALAQGLGAEMEALEELESVQKRARGTSKEAFMTLKDAVAAAHAASQDLTEELREAIKKVEKEVEKRFAAMVTEWEAEVKRQAELREIARRERCRAAAKDLRSQIAASKGEASPAKIAKGKSLEAIAAAVDKTARIPFRGSIFAMKGPKAHAPPATNPAMAAAVGDATKGREATSGPRRGSIFAYTGRKELQSHQAVGSVLEKTCEIRNGLDPTQSTRTQLTGFSPSIGIVFSEVNAVSRLVHSGTAASDGVLKIGDVVLEIDGVDLDGRMAEEVLEEMGKATYSVLVARPKAAKEADSDELPVGEHAGWLHVTRARNLFIGGLTAAGPSYKCWAVVQGNTLTLYEERVRGEKRVQTKLKLDGATCKAPPSSKKAEARQKKALGAELGGGVLHFETAAAHAGAHHADEGGKKKKAGGEGGGTKQQPQVMMDYIERGLFPFRVSWPDRPKDMIIILAAHTQDERKGWTKALGSCIKHIADAAPMKGYLLKKKGRHGGLFKFGWDKRYFELMQADQESGAPPSFMYYDEQKHTGDPKGSIVLNQGAMLMSGESFATPQHTHVFAVSSQGPTDPKPLTTVLAAESAIELDKWTAAVERAVHSFKPKGTKQANLSEEEKELMKKTVDQLKLTLDYMSVEYDKTTTDKQTLATEILRQKQLQAIRKAKGDGASATNLHKNLERDEARLMHRDIDELKALLDYMDVDYDKEIDSKARLVALIINQKRMGAAAAVCQKIARGRSVYGAQRGSSKALTSQDSGTVDVS